MRMWMAIALMMFAAGGYAGKAEAGYYTADEILKYCEDERVAAANICTSYIAGINDITLNYETWGMMKPDFCIPKGATLGQLKKVVIKGLNEQPEKLHLSASSLINNIFYEAFPCD